MNAESIGWTNVKDYAYAFLDKGNLITDLVVLTFFARAICWTCVIGNSCLPPYTMVQNNFSFTSSQRWKQRTDLNQGGCVASTRN